MILPPYLPYYVAVGTAVALFAILYGLNRALANSGWADTDRVRTVSLSGAVLLGWLALAVATSATGVYRVDASAMPTIQYAIALPIVIGMILIWRSELLARIIDAVPQQWLVGVQFYRALGVIFLILYAGGQLPALFALPAGAGDIAVGLLAPVIGFTYAMAPKERAGLVTAWNLFGILDLIVAVTTGFITAPSLLQPIEVQPNSDLMTVLPMILIPIFLVPLSILLHVASLVKLNRSAAIHGTRTATASS